MEKVKRFEDLEIWKLAISLAQDLWSIFYASWFKNFSFQDQIMRACISIGNNIAEWFEAWFNKEFIKFLYYSKRSSWEVRSMLYLAKRFWYIDEVSFTDFSNKTITIAVKIHNLITYLNKLK